MAGESLVSVIIPVFNVYPYLAEALDSVLQQTYKHLEIIVVDDGSTDGSEALCDAYAEKDKRILVVHQENRGLSSARNTGLDRMNGDMLVFLDSDDAYHPDYIGAMMEAMIREKADLVVCKYTRLNTTGRMILTGREKIIPQIDQALYERADALCALADGSINVGVWNKLYKRELWEAVRFPAGHVYEDADVTYQIFDRCKTVYALNKLLYLYRNRPESITRTFSWKNISDRTLAWSHFNSFIEGNIPGIFNEKHLQNRRQLFIKWMIRLYILCSGEAMDDLKEHSDDLKKLIIDTVRETGIENYDLRTKTVYWILCVCPPLLKTVYLIYHPLRLTAGRLFGR